MIQTNETENDSSSRNEDKTENDSSSRNEDETVMRTGPVRRDQLKQIDPNPIIGTILYQGNIRKPLTVTKYINATGNVWVRDNSGNKPIKVQIETLFWNKIDVTEAQAVVITGPVQPVQRDQFEQIDENSIIGTILYQGNIRKPLTVTRYFNNSDNVWVRDNSGNEPIKVPIETLFLSNDLDSPRYTKP
jgi:hypothetical protein